MCTLDVRDGKLWVELSDTDQTDQLSLRALHRHLGPGDWRSEAIQIEQYNGVWWISIDDAGGMHLTGMIELVCRNPDLQSSGLQVELHAIDFESSNEETSCLTGFGDGDMADSEAERIGVDGNWSSRSL